MVKSNNLLSPSTTPAVLSKRRKAEDDDVSGVASKKPRTRVSFSCGECHRRKQKCDRQTPCSHCVARKVPELCQPYTPGKADQDVNARLTRLEQIVEMALPQYASMSPAASVERLQPSYEIKRSPSILEDDNPSQPEDQDPSGGTFHSGKWFGRGASGSIAPSSVLEQLQHLGIPSSNSPERDRFQHIHPDLRKTDRSGVQTSTPSKALLDTVGDDAEPSAADNLKFLMQECGVSPLGITELLQELPSQRNSDILIDYYFSSVNWTRYPVSEKDFRLAYGSICAHNRDGVGAANPTDVRFLPLLFVVLAIAVRLAPEHIAGDARNRRITSTRYYWSSRRSLLIAAAIQPDSLDIVLTRLLSARFLTFDRRITECWSQLGAAVRTAQALGLHRDGATMGMDRPQIEYRRRVWSYLYHADRSYALVLGRPNSIQDDYTSTKPPSNIDDDLPTAYTHDPQPLSTPTPMTFVILRHQLGAIIGRIVHHFQKVQDRIHYSEVIALDEELLKLINTLPPHFSLDPDKSLDDTAKYIPVHRFLLITEILFVRISLHRPYLLRRPNSDRYSRSRIACFESAITDFEVRKAFRESVPKETRDSLSNAYRDFQTAMISGVYFVFEPRGRYAAAMHAILDGFVKEHEGMRELDETTRRELKTIEFLKHKASLVEQAEKEKEKAALSVTGSEQQAQLLLDLQKSTTKPSRTFPTLTSLASLEPRSPSQALSNSIQMQHSPTFQRLQHPVDHIHSPTASGSPDTGDESAAQTLLDHWCNAVSNAPIDLATGAMSWGGPGGGDLSGWVGTIPMLPGTDPRLLGGLEGSDWNYWEALVNQIQRGP
ncbi:hypothetical protein BDN72DRAFT_954408 [Pluteus cervinus]|uniref:Uncharacterized protein n=1 Tax=Pluteus cervinus TaxID=181527 RepID=A0ACD3BE29_9AGAR|nr:hypothetical protein BDN72DRAFT_954408 [Pluteus cervinus]